MDLIQLLERFPLKTSRYRLCSLPSKNLARLFIPEVSYHHTQIPTYYMCKRNSCIYFSFSNQVTEQYNVIRASLERAGAPIGPNDLLISTLARLRDLTLVSLNRREFGRGAGLRLTDFEGLPT